MTEDNVAVDEPEREIEIAPKRRWYVWDMLVAGPLVLLGASLYTYPLLFYVGGSHNNPAPPFVLAMCFAVLLPLAALCLFVLLVRVWWRWPKHVHWSWKLLVLQLGVSIGIFVCLLLPFTRILPPGYKTYTWGFAKYAQTNVDIPAVRSWLSTLDPNDYAGRMSPSRHTLRLDEKDWPEMIARLDPYYVELSLGSDGRLSVRLAWTAGISEFCGVVVGPEDMEIPKTLERTTETYGSKGNESIRYVPGEYRLPLLPGAYVWNDML